jgi:hypothetical protein
VRLGTAAWNEGPAERRTVVAPLPGEPGRVVDLNRVERMRLAKLGEGRADALADVLVPTSLRVALEGGPRCLHRLRQTLAYAEKWHQKSGLPELLAPPLDRVRLLPCLPRPSALRRADGIHLDRLQVRGPGSTLRQFPQPTLAVVGIRGAETFGFCLALEDAPGVVLGAWMVLERPREGLLTLELDGHHRNIPLDSWESLDLPPLRPGEVMLAPPTRLRTLQASGEALPFRILAPFETLELVLDLDAVHPTLQ